ncbi:lipopolysaccharide biosynthesis protein [Stygiobacter electus]|uniref:Oligosaccharide flippase family protein n=1 Tax=Stygiobacter electus TaxID=3032292 RepID=A0AAE3TDM3_9BACT|nr:oligosaccharide flippase family protein [Stygiobacter electus]MDF1613095.1 oligosaccharide flippase family protein [Stygiobacter electus]
MKNQIFSRLFKNFTANAIGQVINILIQFFTVPIFLTFWRKEVYGEWLLLFTIPNYLVLSDFGFGIVASNEITIQMQRKNYKAVSEIFTSIWFLISLISVFIFTIMLIFSKIINFTKILNIQTIVANEVTLIILILIGYTLLSMQTNMIESGFRCIQKYHIGVSYLNSIRLFEWTILIFMVISKHGPVAAAWSLFIGRFIGFMFMIYKLYGTNNYTRFRLKNLSLKWIKKMFSPSVSLMAFPLGNAIVTQGSILFIGWFVGAVGVVLFTISRTYSRIIYQTITMLNYAYWPEYSIAYGADNFLLLKKLGRTSITFAFWISLILFIILSLVANSFFRIWTKGNFSPDIKIIYLLMIDSILISLWNTTSIMLTSDNTHKLIAKGYIFIIIIMMALAALLTNLYSMYGMIIALIIGDACILIYFFNRGLKKLGDAPIEYLRSIFSIQTIFTKLKVDKGDVFFKLWKD